jgi:hypothetical protein
MKNRYYANVNLGPAYVPHQAPGFPLKGIQALDSLQGPGVVCRSGLPTLCVNPWPVSYPCLHRLVLAGLKKTSLVRTQQGLGARHARTPSGTLKRLGSSGFPGSYLPWVPWHPLLFPRLGLPSLLASLSSLALPWMSWPSWLHFFPGSPGFTGFP